MMFGKKITLFKIFGFKVSLDLSWLILAVLITWTLAQGVFPYYIKGLHQSTYWVMGVFGALGLFISIIFHEFWHSLIARRFGLPMRGITLFVFGGVAEMEEEPSSPKAEFLMAVAGPLSSIFLGIGLMAFLFVGRKTGWPEPFNMVIYYLSLINFLLAGFNLLPAFPLDGGRVLRSILWNWKNNLRWATSISSRIGTGFGIALIVLGVFNILFGNFIGGLWWCLLGLFLRGASQMSYQQLILRKALEGEKVKRFMNPHPVAVPRNITINELIEEYVYKHHFKMFPVEENGKLMGCVTIDQIKDIPGDERDKHNIGEIIKDCSEENTISPEEDVVKALARMHQLHKSRLMVAEDSKLLGMISLKDIMELISLKVELNR